MATQAAAYVEAIAAGNHDVEKEKCRRLALGVGNDVGGGAVNSSGEARGFQMMLH